MKYTVKVEINNQVDVNEGQVDKNNNKLPVQLEIIPSYVIVTDINAPGTNKMTVAEIKNVLSQKYSLSNLLENKLFFNKTELINDNDVVDSKILRYVATTTYVSK